MKKIKNYLSYALFAGIGIYLLSMLFIKTGSVSNGDKAPNFTAELIDGSSFQLSDLRGNYVLLDFWGSWCGPCRRENPHIAELYKKYDGKLEVVTVALEKNLKYWKKAAEMDGFTWKYQIVEQSKFVMLSALARKYGVTNLPTKFLITPEGELLSGLSFEEMDALLTKKIKK